MSSTQGYEVAKKSQIVYRANLSCVGFEPGQMKMRLAISLSSQDSSFVLDGTSGFVFYNYLLRKPYKQTPIKQNLALLGSVERMRR